MSEKNQEKQEQRINLVVATKPQWQKIRTYAEKHDMYTSAFIRKAVFSYMANHK